MARATSLASTPAVHAPRVSLSSVPALGNARANSLGSMPVVSAAPVLADEPAEAKVLIVDHMDAVCRALAALIPPGLGVHACRSVNDAQLRMRSGHYKLIFFDVDLPVNGLPALIDQCRLLQREAVFVGVAIAEEDGEAPVHLNDGFVFDDIITRPFDPILVAELSDQFSGAFQHLVELSGENLLRVAAFRGRRPRLDAYLDNLERKLRVQLQGLADACIDQVIVDLTHLPPAHAARVARFVGDLLLKQAVLGLQLRLVAEPQFQEALRALPETREVHCFQTVDEAQLAA